MFAGRKAVRAFATLTAGAVAVVALPAAAVHASPGAKATTEPKYSYADAIRETAYVESSVDGDNDGRKDRIAADIIRPRESAVGLRVPVIMVPSPYNAPVAASAATARDRAGEPKADDEYKDVEDDGTPSKFPDWYDNYFVPRGYAVVLVDLPGTRASEGCLTSGGSTEVLGTKAVVDWVGGRATATNKAGNRVAADWSTGKVGMIGRSWRGTEPIALATMDIPNLRTIVPISAISSWYDYQRSDGQVMGPDSPRRLASRWGSTRKVNPGACRPVWDKMAADSAESTGNYNAFWAERDYAKDVADVKPSVLMVHGLNDWNVRTRNGQQFWRGLNSPKKLWLHQEAHVDPFQTRPAEWTATLHRWFDYWLQGIDTGIMAEPQVGIERAPGQWQSHAAWPPRQSAPVKMHFGQGNTLLPRRDPAAGRQSFKEAFDQGQQKMILAPGQNSANRLMFVGQPLPGDVRLSGTPAITVGARSSGGGATPLTALLVDLGEDSRIAHNVPESGTVRTGREMCVGAGDAVDTGCFAEYGLDVRTSSAEIVTEGWTNTSHRESTRFVSPVKPGTQYTFRWQLQPEDYVFKAGHRIAVVIAGTDCTMISVPGTNDDCSVPAEDPWPKTTMDVDLANSHIELPLADS
ncbi:CocE/NonD family hydrolase [Kibdelosporangium phytohabitans]|uniref:CocE/NonD family hydrolase n=1 Tax=Kibdelosporangium phytohabitans TaxID=860235 RepID=UPI0009F84EF4|nr:CocE/NonD family hydrolase [Kibdelosporangium phytohabitans]MBE1464870.1 X-Pro dipeptidyl-peptidase [Kibdelosporangium phytohabitans]